MIGADRSPAALALGVGVLQLLHLLVQRFLESILTYHQEKVGNGGIAVVTEHTPAEVGVLVHLPDLVLGEVAVLGSWPIPAILLGRGFHQVLGRLY